MWLYMIRAKDGYARKLAHMWHKLFQVAEYVENIPCISNLHACRAFRIYMHAVSIIHSDAHL